MYRLEILFPDWEFFFKCFTKLKYNNNVRKHTFYGFYCMSTYHFWLFKKSSTFWIPPAHFILSPILLGMTPHLCYLRDTLSLFLFSFLPSFYLKSSPFAHRSPYPTLGQILHIFSEPTTVPCEPVMQGTDCFQMLLQLLENTDL